MEIAGATVSVKLRLALSPAESTTWSVNELVFPLGMPAILPAGSRVRPAGKAPPETDQRYGALPP